MGASPVDPRDRITVLVHYYRAMVGRADVWRTRMDTATHWAIGTTAAIVSFALGNAAAPHYVVLIACLLTAVFLVLEARRLTFYHLWQQRVLRLEEHLIRPVVEGRSPDADAHVARLAETLAPHLGRTAPTMPLLKAAARRLRRVYLSLFAVQLLAWILDLSLPASRGASAAAWTARARIGAVPGEAVIALAAAAFAAAGLLALAAGGVDHARGTARPPSPGAPETSDPDRG